jgi:serine/threonine-protein kinase RsbW
MLPLSTLVIDPASTGFTAVHSTKLTYPGTLASVSAARRRVRELLRRSPRADEAELIAAELMSNAVRHTPSGAAGGTFTVCVRHGAGWARIEVLDLGRQTWPGPPDDGPHASDAALTAFAESGRGLRLVAAIADEHGHAASGSLGQVCWATLTW